MKKILIVPMLSILVLSAGCGRNDKQNQQSVSAPMDTLQQKHEGQNNEEETETAGELVLNNGAKWQANIETTEGIQKMLSIVNEYLNKGDTDNKKLSGSLENEFTIIFQKCTMKGMAHEQLHNFLLPFKKSIEKLKESKQVEDVKEIQSYLNNYQNFFE